MAFRIFFLALVALGLAGFGASVWIGTHPRPSHPAPPPMERIVVAAHPLKSGTLLRPEDITGKEIPLGTAPPTASLDSETVRAHFYGAMLRRDLVAGDPLLPADIIRPGDHGFLAAVLAPSMRAVTVAVDMVSANAGLIWPGDRVDLILTETLDPKITPPSRRIAAETVVHDVRVLAVDQRLVQSATSVAAEAPSVKTVTLEVTSEQAQAIMVATKLGTLSLALRPTTERKENGEEVPAAAAEGVSSPVTWAGKVSSALSKVSPPPAQNRGWTVRVYPGRADGKEFHFQ
jgi:pilus assembly protein CpaB